MLPEAIDANGLKLCVSVAVVNEDGLILFGRRRDTGLWVLPGGHLNSGESPQIGAAREMFEEVGLRPEGWAFLGSGCVPGGEDGVKVKVFCYKANVSQAEPSGEGDPDQEMGEFQWIDITMGLPDFIGQNLQHHDNVTLKLLAVQAGVIDNNDTLGHPVPVEHGLALKSEEDLSKGRLGAAMLAGTLLASPMAKEPAAHINPPAFGHMGETEKDLPKPPVVWNDDGLGSHLTHISHLESNNCRNLNHKPHSKGPMWTDFGPLGFKPVTAQDQYKRSPRLQKQFPGLNTPDSFLYEFQNNPNFYKAVARSHWNTLLQTAGQDPNKAAYGWRWGIGRIQDTPDEIDQDPYVVKFKALGQALAAKMEKHALEKAVHHSDLKGVAAGTKSDIGPATVDHVPHTGMHPSANADRVHDYRSNILNNPKRVKRVVVAKLNAKNTQMQWNSDKDGLHSEDGKYHVLVNPETATWQAHGPGGLLGEGSMFQAQRLAHAHYHAHNQPKRNPDSADVEGGISRKSVFASPVTGQSYMVKPYHEGITNATKSFQNHHIQGWSEMTNQALYHAGGIGDLHQKVHVDEHDLALKPKKYYDSAQQKWITKPVQGTNKQPALVIAMDPGYQSAEKADEIARDQWRQANPNAAPNAYRPDFGPDIKHQAKQIALMDFLTNNLDRHHLNLLYHPDKKKLLAIDHSRSFQYKKSDKWSDNSSPSNKVDNLANYTHNGATSFFDKPPNRGNRGHKRDEDFFDRHQDRLQEWDKAFGWWAEKGPAIRAELEKHLSSIKDGRIRNHIRRNFEERADKLDEIAANDPSNYDENFETQHTQVPMHRWGRGT